jgi:hypothetical protein
MMGNLTVYYRTVVCVKTCCVTYIIHTYIQCIISCMYCTFQHGLMAHALQLLHYPVYLLYVPVVRGAYLINLLLSSQAK